MPTSSPLTPAPRRASRASSQSTRARTPRSALGGLPCAWLIPNSDLKTPAHPAIAKDRVRYVGDAVAVVVAETRYQAEDALEHIVVEYEPLDVVINPKEATQAGAPQLHDEAPNNVAFTWAVAGGDADAAFAEAEVTVSDVITLPRLIANPMEPRSAIAQWVGATGELTLWNTSQNPHIARFLTSVVTGVPEHKIRVIAPEVGGGFGSKIPFYPDEAITAFCSMRLGVPGEVDGDPQRELPGYHPGPRPRRRGGNGGQRGREDNRPAHDGLRRAGRLSLDGKLPASRQSSTG